MRGQWVPEHFAVSMEPRKAEALLKLLKEVDSDDGFPLNEFEQEVVDEFIAAVERDDSTSVSR